MSTNKFAKSRMFYGLRVPAVSLAMIIQGVALVALFTLGAPDVANGQRVRTYSQSEVERLMRDVEQSSREFQRDFDTWLDSSRLDGQQREDRYNRQVQSLTSALTTLRSNFDSRNDWWLARSDMIRVLNEARPINSLLRGREVRGRLDGQWNRLRRNIDRLATAFNLPPVGSTFTGNQAGFPPQGGNARNCGITGTFRGYTNNGESELTIGANGEASIRSLLTNAIYSGRCVNDVLYFDWGAFNLVRDGRGVSTVEIGNTSNRTPYRRVSGRDTGVGFPTQGYPNQYPNPNYPDQTGVVPNWAIGSFRGMTDSGEAELTISANGTATARSLTTNQIHSGRYVNDVLTFEWGSFRIVREGRGISTVEINNPANRTSYRRVN